MYKTTHHGLIYGTDHKPTWEERANIHPHFETAVLRTQFRTQTFRINRKTTNSSTETTGYAKGIAGFAKTSLQAHQGSQLEPRTNTGLHLTGLRDDSSASLDHLSNIYECHTLTARLAMLVMDFNNLRYQRTNPEFGRGGGEIQHRISNRPQKLR
jgi:hypothetical protein